MPTLLVGFGGTGSKVMNSISRKVYTVFCIICIDCSESMSINRHNTAQRRNETIVFELSEKMCKGYADLLRRRFSRILGKSVRNKYRSVVNEIRESLYRLIRKQDILKTAWQDRNGIFFRDVEFNESIICAKDQYIRNIGLFQESLYQGKTEQNNCRINQYRLENGWIETKNQGNSEQLSVQLTRLQNQSSGMFLQEFLCWRSTIQFCDRVSGKTDTIKVRVCDCLWRLVLPNRMDKIYVFSPKLQTLCENRHMSIMSEA